MVVELKTLSANLAGSFAENGTDLPHEIACREAGQAAECPGIVLREHVLDDAGIGPETGFARVARARWPRVIARAPTIENEEAGS